MHTVSSSVCIVVDVSIRTGETARRSSTKSTVPLRWLEDPTAVDTTCSRSRPLTCASTATCAYHALAFSRLRAAKAVSRLVCVSPPLVPTLHLSAVVLRALVHHLRKVTDKLANAAQV